MSAFELGKLHKKMGYSVYYNPFRNKGSAEDWFSWLDGFNF